MSSLNAEILPPLSQIFGCRGSAGAGALRCRLAGQPVGLVPVRSGGSRPLAAGLVQLHVAEHDAAEHDHVAVAQLRLLDAAAVDERAVGAAVIEDARAPRAGNEDRVPARDRAVVEAQVGGEAAADVQRLALERDRQRARRGPVPRGTGRARWARSATAWWRMRSSRQAIASKRSVVPSTAGGEITVSVLMGQANSSRLRVRLRVA